MYSLSVLQVHRCRHDGANDAQENKLYNLYTDFSMNFSILLSLCRCALHLFKNTR